MCVLLNEPTSHKFLSVKKFHITDYRLDCCSLPVYYNQIKLLSYPLCTRESNFVEKLFKQLQAIKTKMVVFSVVQSGVERQLGQLCTVCQSQSHTCGVLGCWSTWCALSILPLLIKYMGILESLKLYFHMKYIRQECRKIQKKSIKDQCLPNLCFTTYFWKIVLIITDLLQGVPKKNHLLECNSVIAQRCFSCQNMGILGF